MKSSTRQFKDLLNTVPRKTMAKFHELHDCLVQAEAYSKRAEQLRNEITTELSPGKYGAYTIYKVGRQRIEVQAYTRSGFTAIRRSKNRLS